MATDSISIPASSEDLLKQLTEQSGDLKSLALVLANLQLFRDKNEAQKESTEGDKSTKKTNPRSRPKLIGKVANSVSSTSSQGSKGSVKVVEKTLSNAGDSDGTGSSNSSRRRRGRRGRRRRLRKQKQQQAERAAELLAKMVGTQALVAPSQQTLSPPQQFFRYPRMLPKRDVLHDPVTGENRPVWSMTVPIVCHQTNTPFYAQCSTARQGYCSRCGVLRKGSKKVGSACSQQGCGERLTAKYHRWYPGLIRLEPFGKERSKEDYAKHKDLFEKFNISWNNEDELSFVVENYLLMKIFLVSPDFDVAPLHVERSYMIGVFAGRAFRTGALARKFLRDGLRLMSFRADFPKNMKHKPDERAKIVEEMNQIFFQGRFRCYFHGHQSNIEGWYDPTQVDPATVQSYLTAVCARHGDTKMGMIPAQTALKNRHQYPKNPSRFDFARQHPPKKPSKRSSRNSDTKSTTNATDSSDSSEPNSPQYYYTQPPASVSYVPVYVSGGQQFMGMPMAPAPAHPMMYHPYGGHQGYIQQQPANGQQADASHYDARGAKYQYPSQPHFVPMQMQPIYSN